MKDAALLTLFNHEDIAVHLIGWGVPIFIALFTLLYKGIWKSINTNDKDAHERMDVLEDKQDRIDRELQRLLGEHCVRHGDWNGIERRATPRRTTDDRREITDEPDANRLRNVSEGLSGESGRSTTGSIQADGLRVDGSPEDWSIQEYKGTTQPVHPAD